MTVAVLGGAAVAMTVRPSDSSGASSPLCRDTSRRFLPCRFFLFILFLPSSRLYLSVSLSISPVFWFLCFGCSSLSLSRSVSLSFGFSPLLLPFSLFSLPFSFLFLPPFFFLHSDGIYRGRGSWKDPAPSHRCAWGGKPPLYLVTAPAETSNGDVACRTRPLCLLVMRSCRWRPVLALKHVGGRDKGKKIKLPFPCCTSRGRRRRNSVASKRHRFIFFFSTHETAPFHLFFFNA